MGKFYDVMLMLLVLSTVAIINSCSHGDSADKLVNDIPNDSLLQIVQTDDLLTGDLEQMFEEFYSKNKYAKEKRIVLEIPDNMKIVTSIELDKKQEEIKMVLEKLDSLASSRGMKLYIKIKGVYFTKD